LAFIAGDEAAMKEQIERTTGTSLEAGMLAAQAAAAATSGQLVNAREFTNRSIDLALRRGLKEGASGYSAGSALWEAAYGNCRRSKDTVTRTLAIARGGNTVSWSALALALCGESNPLQSLLDEMTGRFAQDSFFKSYWVPMTRAAVEIHRGKPAEAVQLLETARRGETGMNPYLWPAYVRGLAYLAQRDGRGAVGEFQKVLDHQGVLAPFSFSPGASTLYPLARLGLARAAAISGDTAASRKAYEDFFALWQNADSDVPLLQQARQEYLRLQ
jgi:hypothetical protein